MLCPEYVDKCPICQPGRQFYGCDEDTWCEHMTAEHGTDSLGHYAHFLWGYHTGEDCECVKENWFNGRPDPIIERDDDD